MFTLHIYTHTHTHIFIETNKSYLCSKWARCCYSNLNFTVLALKRRLQVVWHSDCLFVITCAAFSPVGLCSLPLETMEIEITTNNNAIIIIWLPWIQFPLK